MTTETTLLVHWEMPSDGTDNVLAKCKNDNTPNVWARYFVRSTWHLFEWWAEIPAPVKPKRFVVEERDGFVGPFCVKHERGGNCSAYYIPTREAAQRIADIYEETTP